MGKLQENIKIVQISIEVNSNSVGRIAEQIGESIINRGWESYITYARNNNPSRSRTIKIGNKFDLYYHGINTRLFDTHGLHSKNATKKLINTLKNIRPDIIHLHHIHGYFINYILLFKFLKEIDIPVIWTFHDCWSFTGHCAYFENINCTKWLTECYNCELKKEYPKSIGLDNSTNNFRLKKEFFNSLNNLTIVPVSKWMENLVKKSFLNTNEIQTIENGIDTNVFHNNEEIRIEFRNKIQSNDKFVILGVANEWDKRKGLEDFIELSKKIDQKRFQIVLVGLNKYQLEQLPQSCIGIYRTENVSELVGYYNAADVFFNPTSEDNFPTTNLEALACGKPVITYATGGSIESVDEKCGFVVDVNDLNRVENILLELNLQGAKSYERACRNRAETNYNKVKQFSKYIFLYEKMINQTLKNSYDRT